MKKVRFIGLDVHKDTITIAVAESTREAAVVLGTIANSDYALLKELNQLGEAKHLRICYEAGPTGFHLARELNRLGYCCVVVAPALVPVKRGDRIKTDRRDAVKLAHFLRSGDLTEVAIPAQQTEAMRDLERCRGDAKKQEQIARRQLDQFLLRWGRRWSRPTKWTQEHVAWIEQQTFVEPVSVRVRDDYLATLRAATQRVEELDRVIADFVSSWALAPLVRSLMALRGVALISAVTLAAEIGNFQRFATAKHFMAFLGLVPSENSSGQSRRRGGITRMGNSHARRILVEAAWQYRFQARQTRAIQVRARQAPESVRQIAWKAQKRLCGRYRRLSDRGKPTTVVATAIARELAGFVWAIARQVCADDGRPMAGSAGTPAPAFGAMADESRGSPADPSLSH
jgi:transposase